MVYSVVNRPEENGKVWRFELMKVVAMKIRVFWTDAASTAKSLLTRRSSLLPSYSGCSRLGLPSRQKGNNLLRDVVNCLYQSARRYVPECMNHRMLTLDPHDCLIYWKLRNMSVGCGDFHARVRMALILH